MVVATFSQVKIDESLDTFSAEQRFHGERLDAIESLGHCYSDIDQPIVHPTSASTTVVSDVHTWISDLCDT